MTSSMASTSLSLELKFPDRPESDGRIHVVVPDAVIPGDHFLVADDAVVNAEIPLPGADLDGEGMGRCDRSRPGCREAVVPEGVAVLPVEEEGAMPPGDEDLPRAFLDMKKSLVDVWTTSPVECCPLTSSAMQSACRRTEVFHDECPVNPNIPHIAYLPAAPVSRLSAVRNLAMLTVWRQYLFDRNVRQVQVSVSSGLRMTTWINSLLRLRTSQELLTNPRG